MEKEKVSTLLEITLNRMIEFTIYENVCFNLSTLPCELQIKFENELEEELTWLVCDELEYQESDGMKFFCLLINVKR
jgi:hypothetical protein